MTVTTRPLHRYDVAAARATTGSCSINWQRQLRYDSRCSMDWRRQLCYDSYVMAVTTKPLQRYNVAAARATTWPIN